MGKVWTTLMRTAVVVLGCLAGMHIGVELTGLADASVWGAIAGTLVALAAIPRKGRCPSYLTPVSSSMAE